MKSLYLPIFPLFMFTDTSARWVVLAFVASLSFFGSVFCFAEADRRQHE
jgi:hypothetical protein